MIDGKGWWKRKPESRSRDDEDETTAAMRHAALVNSRVLLAASLGLVPTVAGRLRSLKFVWVEDISDACRSQFFVEEPEFPLHVLIVISPGWQAFRYDNLCAVSQFQAATSVAFQVLRDLLGNAGSFSPLHLLETFASVRVEGYPETVWLRIFVGNEVGLHVPLLHRSFNVDAASLTFHHCSVSLPDWLRQRYCSGNC
jgi:hypothetical protein